MSVTEVFAWTSFVVLRLRKLTGRLFKQAIVLACLVNIIIVQDQLNHNENYSIALQ